MIVFKMAHKPQDQKSNANTSHDETSASVSETKTF